MSLRTSEAGSRMEKCILWMHTAIIVIWLAGGHAAAHLNTFQFHLNTFKYFNPTPQVICMTATEEPAWEDKEEGVGAPGACALGLIDSFVLFWNDNRVRTHHIDLIGKYGLGLVKHRPKCVISKTEVGTWWYTVKALHPLKLSWAELFFFPDLISRCLDTSERLEKHGQR